MTELSRPRIKICGMTRLEDAKLASELGAWAIGFIFSAASPRATTPEVAGEIVRALARPALKTVGVFIDAAEKEIVRAVSVSGISTVQLHGSETPEFCSGLRRLLPGVGVIKALRPRGHGELAGLSLYRAACEAVLLDTYVTGVPGGTGLAGDWALAAEAARDERVILAGGLNPGNIEAALRTPGIYGVDASSGLEEDAGPEIRRENERFF